MAGIPARLLSRALPLAAAAIIAWAQVAGAAAEKVAAQNAKPKDNIYEQVELFADSISAIRDGYVEETDSKKLIYGAMKGMLSSLDDYSQFMGPDEYREIQVETKGEFGGIGVEISMRDGVITVVTPLAGTPAEAAGMKPNDKVVRIEGKSTKKMSLDDAVKKMRGRPGTPVTLTLWRDQKVFDFTVKRDTIQVNSLKRSEMLEDRIGYIKLIEFQENTARDLDEALKKLESQGMDSLILDLRNNHGGLLNGAVDVSERFLPKDRAIVSIKTRDPKKAEVFKSGGKHYRGGYPLIVMVNEGSASASEIVAGAIKDNKAGIVLGAKTFGKASVQTVIPLRDGSGLRFTTALYLTPGGSLIKDEGITPDVVVANQAAAKTKRSDADEIFEAVDDETEGKPPAQAGKTHGDAEPKDKSKDAAPAPVAGKTDLKRDGQLESAVNLMKAIRIYRARNT